MGCNSSKLHRFPVVALCRERCKYLEEALCLCYALADAHVAYMESLKTLGPALRQFFCQLSDDAPDPAIKNADDKKAKEQPIPASSASPSRSHSDSETLLHSGSESEATDTFTHRNHFQFLDYHETLNMVPDSVHNFIHSGYSWGSSKPQSPPAPPPSNLEWDLFRLFETYEAPYIPYRSKTEEANMKSEKESDHPCANMKKEGLISKCYGDTKDDTRFISQNKELFQPREKGNNETMKKRKGVLELTEEMEGLLLRASESGNEVLEMLGVGKFRYHQNIAADSNTASCKLLRLFTPSSPVVYSKSSIAKSFKVKTGPSLQSFQKEVGTISWNLTSTMKKLCIWEKKLYDEVQAVEKLHILHEKKCRQLRQMNKNDGDTRKLDSIADHLSDLSTKMNISIQMIDNISTTINKLREEELWPHVTNLILRLAGMWKAMLNCTRAQYQVILEVNELTSNIKLISNPHLSAAVKLKHEIQKWNFSFLDLIYVQRSQVKALNNWLQSCLLHRPTETTDDSLPFSPRRIGAPPLFVICNQWSVELEKLSEKEVAEALQGAIVILDNMVGQHIVVLQQQFIDPDLERAMKLLEREERKMLKVMCARVKKLAPLATGEIGSLLTGQRVLQNELISSNDLHLGFKGIFAAIEGYSGKSVQVYEQLCRQIEENKHV